MFDSLNKKYIYTFTLMSCALFIVLNLILGPIALFGLTEFIQNKTGYFFGVGTETFDYLVIASIPIFGLILAKKRNRKSLKEILKQNIIILFCCFVTFSLGLLILTTKIGSVSENPFIPQCIRREPFQQYSTFFIALGILFPFLILKRVSEEKANDIEEIGNEKK